MAQQHDVQKVMEKPWMKHSIMWWQYWMFKLSFMYFKWCYFGSLHFQYKNRIKMKASILLLMYYDSNSLIHFISLIFCHVSKLINLFFPGLKDIDNSIPFSIERYLYRLSSCSMWFIATHGREFNWTCKNCYCPLHQGIRMNENLFSISY